MDEWEKRKRQLNHKLIQGDAHVKFQCTNVDSISKLHTRKLSIATKFTQSHDINLDGNVVI